MKYLAIECVMASALAAFENRRKNKIDVGAFTWNSKHCKYKQMTQTFIVEFEIKRNSLKAFTVPVESEHLP